LERDIKKIELTVGNPLRRRRSALDCIAFKEEEKKEEEEEEEEEEEKKKKKKKKKKKEEEEEKQEKNSLNDKVLELIYWIKHNETLVYCVLP
jgi:hypothetical protein